MRDPVVYEIQECLRTLSRTNPTMPKIVPDGIYGEETRKAICDFQEDVGLPVTGTVDLVTWNELLKESAKSAEILGQSNPIFPFEMKMASGTLSKGDQLNLVFIVQTVINTLCGVFKSLRPMQVDGYYGDMTEENVKMFQAMHGLPETGCIDKLTWNRLALAYNKYVDRE